jgi:hypothetical protein
VATFSELIDNIKQSDKQVVLLGEQHIYSFDDPNRPRNYRKVVLDLIPQLQTIGYDRLALELYPDSHACFDRFCRGTTDFAELKTELRGANNGLDLAGFDEDLCNCIRDWVSVGGSLDFINSEVPKEKFALPSNQGRDEVMYQRIKSACDDKHRVVVLVGEGHTYIRSQQERERQLNSGAGDEIINWLEIFADNKADAAAAKADPNILRKYAYSSAAEKLFDSGVSLYSFSEVLASKSPNASTTTFPSVPLLKNELSPALQKIAFSWQVTQVAPYLCAQTVWNNVTELDALMFDMYVQTTL